MLYIPPHFRETDTALLQAEMKRIGFATLTTVGPDGPLIVTFLSCPTQRSVRSDKSAATSPAPTLNGATAIW